MVRETLLDTDFLKKLERLTILTKKVITGRLKGEKRSRKRGQSVEFADFRNYVPGDDIRFIDWNTYARLEKFFVKLFVEEEDITIYILIDTSKSISFGTPPKILYAKKLAASLGYIGLSNLNRVIISEMKFGSNKDTKAMRGKSEIHRMLNFLDELEADGKTTLAESTRIFALKHKRKGFLIIISDFLDKAGYEAPLRNIIARDLDVFVFQILSANEYEPELTGDLRLVDSEDEEYAEVTISDRLIKSYKKTLSDYCSQIKNFCLKRGISYLFTLTSYPFEEMIFNYLKTAGILK